MPPITDDERHLKKMQWEIELYRSDEQALPGLIHWLDGRIGTLAACPRDLVERMREELRIMEEINEMARKGTLPEVLPRDNPTLQDALSAMERLIAQALSAIRTSEARGTRQ